MDAASGVSRKGKSEPTPSLLTSGRLETHYLSGVAETTSLPRQISESAALAMASLMERTDTIDLAWFDKRELEQAGHNVQQEDGVTNVPDLRSNHYDIHDLDYTRLGDIASRVAKAVENCQYHRFREKQGSGIVSRRRSTAPHRHENV